MWRHTFAAAGQQQSYTQDLCAQHHEQSCMFGHQPGSYCYQVCDSLSAGCSFCAVLVREQKQTGHFQKLVAATKLPVIEQPQVMPIPPGTMVDVFGIDPGGDGSASWVRVRDHVSLVKVISFKVTENWEAYLCAMARQPLIDKIAFEDVHSFTGQGVKSMFSFGFNTGSAHAAIKIAGRNYELVEPKVWQRRCGLPHRDEIADRAKRRAQLAKDQQALAIKLFPELIHHNKRAGGDVFASTLIAYAGALDVLGVPLGTVI